MPAKTATSKPGTVVVVPLPVNGLGEGDVPADEAELALGTLVSVGVLVDAEGIVALAPGGFVFVIEAPGIPGAVEAADIEA